MVENETNLWRTSMLASFQDEQGNEYRYYFVETDPAVGGDYEITYSGQSQGLLNGGTAKITNKVKSEKGTLVVNKSVLYNGAADTEASGKTITVGLYSDANAQFPVTHTVSDEEVNWTETITLGANGSGTASFSELDYGTYYVFELGANDSPITGSSGTIDGIAYTVDYDDNGKTLNRDTQTAAVTITNSIEEKGSLQVTKEIQVGGAKADLSGEFKAALYQVTKTIDDSTDPATEIEEETIVGEPQTITVTNGASAAATFSDLTVGAVYRVYEVTVDGDTVTKVDSLYGQYTVAYENQEVTIPRGIGKDVTGTKVVNNIETTSIKVDKKWFQSDGTTDITSAIKNASITVELTDGTSDVTADAYGNAIAAQTLDGSETTPWTYEWTNLPKYNASGSEIAYQVVETSAKVASGTELLAADVTADTDETNANELHLSNTLPTVDIRAGKAWLNLDNTTTAPTGAEVTFTLLADGETTDHTVVVNGADETVDSEGTAVTPASGDYEGANWTAYFTNLPKYSDTGAEIAYTVRETGTWAAYEADGDDTVSDGGIITNKEMSIDISILKVDAATDSALTGAKFVLRQYDGSGYHTPAKTWDEQAVSTQEGKTGTLTFEKLTIGYYELEETESPAGYIKTSANPKFAVTADASGSLKVEFTDTEMVTYESTNKTFTVQNQAGAALPNTGGPGTTFFTILGTLLISLAGTLLLKRRKYRL